MNGDNGNGNGNDADTGGYDIPPEPIRYPGLWEQHDLAMKEIDNKNFLAEKEMNEARTEYLKALSESKETDTALVDIMPEKPKAALPIMLIAGIALLLWGKIL